LSHGISCHAASWLALEPAIEQAFTGVDIRIF
jgi:hypothetical protein